MAREAKTIPKEWKDIGVLYVVNVDKQWDMVDEFTALEARLSRGERLTEKESARLAELRAEMPKLLMARVQPYSGDEFLRIQNNHITSAIELKVGPNRTAKMKGANPNSVAEEIAVDVIEKRVTELFNYTKAVPELDADNMPVYDEAGNVKIRSRSPITTGADLAAFVRAPDCWEAERDVVEDLFIAVRDRSHLEAGMGKASASRRAFSPAATRL